MAVAARDAFHMLGPPEGYLPLAEMTIYLATAPKSNSAKVALGEALAAAQETPAAPVPLHIRNAPTGLMKELGYGKGYRYAHDSPDAYLPQEYLPDELRGTAFYTPGGFGYEKRVAERMEWWERKKREGGGGGEGGERDPGAERGRTRHARAPCDAPHRSAGARHRRVDPARDLQPLRWSALGLSSEEGADGAQRRGGLLVLAAALGGCAGLGNALKEPDVRLERVVVRDVGLRGGSLDLIVERGQSQRLRPPGHRAGAGLRRGGLARRRRALRRRLQRRQKGDQTDAHAAAPVRAGPASAARSGPR